MINKVCACWHVHVLQFSFFHDFIYIYVDPFFLDVAFVAGVEPLLCEFLHFCLIKTGGGMKERKYWG